MPETLVGRKSKPNEWSLAPPTKPAAPRTTAWTPRCRRRISTTRRRTTTPGPRHRADHQPDPARSRSSDFQLVFNPNSYAAGNKRTPVWHRSMERPGQQPAAGDHRRPGQRHPAPEHRRPGPPHRHHPAPSPEDREGIQRHARRRGHGADGLPAGCEWRRSTSAKHG